MTEEELSALTITSFEDFEAGQSGSNFLLEEGSYDGAIVCGYALQKANFEGKDRVLVNLLWQVATPEGEATTIRGNSWSISANENSKMRTELSKWFDTQDWGKVCEILVKGGILVKHEDGSAHFELANFIGKRGKLLISEKTSKKGAKFNVIASISPAKNKGAFTYAEVPWFLVEGEDIIAAKLADGIQVHHKEEKKQGDYQPNPAIASEYAQPQQQPGQFVSPKTKMPAKPKTKVTTFQAQPQAQPQPQPQQFQNNQMWPAATTPTAPNPTPLVNDEEDLPF